MPDNLPEGLAEEIAEDFQPQPSPNGTNEKPTDKGNEQPAEQPAQENQESETIETNTSASITDEDILKTINEKTGGEFTDLNTLKETIAQVGTIQKENAKLLKEIAELKTAAPKDDKGKALLKAYNSGIALDTYSKVQSLDIEKMSPKDLMVEMLVMKNKLTPDEAVNLVETEYMLGEEYDSDDKTVKAKSVKLKIDSQGAADYLNEWKQQATVPPAEKKVAELQKKWEGVSEKVMDVVSDKIVFSYEGHNYKYSLPQEEKTELLRAFNSSLESLPDNIDPNSAEGQKMAEEMMNTLIYGTQFNKIMNATMTAHKANEIKKKANTTVGLNEQKPGAGVHDAEDKFVLELERNYGR